MTTKNVLIFPAGTEIGLEIFQALKNCKEVKLFGAGQDVSNHAVFLYKPYYHISNIHNEGWLDELISLCCELKIDYIFPGYDDVIVELSRHRNKIPAKIIAPTIEVCEITRSKLQTYNILKNVVKTPKIFEAPDDISKFPVLIKPDKGQGSFGVKKIDSLQELLLNLEETPDRIISEYLPGKEYTVDCFSDREQGLLFAGARERIRTRNGISVHSRTIDIPGIAEWAKKISKVLKMNGAWFFQVKESQDGELVLLEVAPRIAGSMATHRVKGINFPLLSIFEEERLPLNIQANNYLVEIDRALRNRYKHNIEFSQLYIDYDDTIIVNGKINQEAIQLIYQCINDKKRISLITRHQGNLEDSLKSFKLHHIFDEIIHIQNKSKKSLHIKNANGAIFIDDSFSERQDVANRLGILTFDCSMIELLLKE